MPGVLARWYGIARSAAIYYGDPGKRRRARALYAGFVGPGALCFDIGAHLGDRIGHFLALGGRVVALEPQRDLMRVLRVLYGRNPRVALVEAAAGATAGEARLLGVDGNPTVASLSPGWVAAVSQSAGFRGLEWRPAGNVAVTTLDALITRHGRPDFCKIDVEGFELEVLRGLSQPLAAVSLEYVTATLDIALAGIERLAALGPYRFSFSPGETMQLAGGWVAPHEITRRLRALPRDRGSGDVYARLNKSDE